MLKLSKHSRYAENPIEEEDEFANRLEGKGRKIVRLNRGDPAVYFSTPSYIVDEYLDALKSGMTGYSFNAGVRELREAIARRHKRLYGLDVGYEQVLVTQGVSEAIIFANASLIDLGDKAIVFRPYYTLYQSALKINGGVPIYVQCREEDRFRLNPDNLRKTIRANRKKRIKYLIFANPSNPTGAVTPRSVLKEIVDIANDNDMFIISDEIYDELVYNNARFTSISEVSKGVPTVVFGGASKGFDSTGFRIGYAIFPEADRFSNALKEKMTDYAKMRLCANTPAQYAFARAIDDVKVHRRTVDSMVKKIEARINFTHRLINESDYLTAAKPEGAFYLLAKVDMSRTRLKGDRQIARGLLEEEGVEITRGSGFGAPNHIRIVALAPEEILGSAIRKIDKFFVRHSR